MGGQFSCLDFSCELKAIKRLGTIHDAHVIKQTMIVNHIGDIGAIILSKALRGNTKPVNLILVVTMIKTDDS